MNQSCQSYESCSGHPCSGCIHPAVIRCIAVCIHCAGGGIQIVVQAVYLYPAGCHVAVCVKIIPLAVYILPLGCRIGSVCVLPPPAHMVGCLFPAFGDRISGCLFRGSFPVALGIVAGFYRTHFKCVGSIFRHPVRKVIEGIIYGQSRVSAVRRRYEGAIPI